MANRVWTPVPLAGVRIDDRFWSPRQQFNREHTIPHQYDQCLQTGRIDALKLLWKPGDQPVPHIFWESDIAKWIEAASYSLVTHPDPQLDARLDEVIALLASAQQPDGYLNVYFTVVKPGRRWTDLRDAHELYCAGHLIEAGVAHFQATGKRSLLDVVCRYADHIAVTFGREPGRKRGYCGHEEVELALVKLYRATGNALYLHLSQYFVDERGREPYYFDQEAIDRGGPSYFEEHFKRSGLRNMREYNQSHRPVRDQDMVVGHAVRAMYLYSAMADLAAESDDSSLRDACRRLWTHLVTTRMYLTGGIGSAAANEGFTEDYDLPNETAYAETCAAIGLVFWAHRMTLLFGDASYADVLERALYNGVISGVSHEGTTFFYDNPLASHGTKHRQGWFDVACCPPNLARLLASLGQYIYATSDTDVAVHLYIQSTARITRPETTINLRQSTGYPWDGAVTLQVDPDQPAVFGLRLRLPGWCRHATLSVNGDVLDVASRLSAGYLRIEREWHTGDRVDLVLDMPVERVYAHPNVQADGGCVALQRGPLVYCVEGADNPRVSPYALFLPRETPLDATYQQDVLGGLVMLSGSALAADDAGWEATLYRQAPASWTPASLTAIPYYAWDNRAPGPMRVWLHELAGPARDA